MKSVRLGIVAVAFASIGGASCSASSHGIDEDYAFQTSHFMRRTAYRDSTKIAADVNANGAYSSINEDYDSTHSGTWYIEQQREGWHAIAAGLADGDIDAIDRGLKIFNWGWRQQDPDGGFHCGGLGRSFHSTSFFVEACAHACLLLEASPYASRYQAQVDAMKPHLIQAVHWMESDEDEGKRYNHPYTHRRYLVACAYGETGVLVSDHDMIDRSRDFVRDALSMQDPSGFNPEKDGFDVSYNSVGLNYAERYYWIVADKDLRDGIYAMLQKDTAWISTCVRPDGSVDTSGSTRVNGQNSEISPLGVKKKLAVAEVYESLAGWSKISGDKSYEDLAMKVANGPRDRD